jgi:hypothetical protein
VSRPKRDLGKAIVRTDAELARLAQITPTDIFNARLKVSELGPDQVRGLMEATPEPPKNDA